MDWVKLGEYGALVVALLVIMVMSLGLFEMLRKKFREAPTGDRREPRVVFAECPNHIEGLDSTLNALVVECHTISGMNRQQTAILQRNSVGIDTLVESHKPVGGREWWKATEASEKIQVEILSATRDMQTGISELVRLARKNGT